MDNEFKRPLYDLPYYNKLNQQLEQETGDYLRMKTTNPKLYSNDLRHQYVSALYARNKGENLAKFLGDANEFFDFNQSGRLDSETDKINNEIGRQYGISNPDIPRENLFDLMWNDYRKNRSYKDKKLKEAGYRNNLNY